MKRFVLGALVALALLFCVPTAKAQTYFRVPFDSYGFCFRLSAPGDQAISASCTVTVYTAGTLTPATIYSSSAGAALANPFAATSTGVFTFYAVAGSYDVRLSGGTPAITPYTVSNVVVSAGGSGAALLSSNNAWTGTNTFNNTLTANSTTALNGLTNLGLKTGNIAQKPSASDVVLYVSTTGLDASDCLSWGTACLTISGAFDKLPSTGGTIYISDGVQVNAAGATEGLYICGPNNDVGAGPDCVSGSPPAGWRAQKRLTIIGAECRGNASNSRRAACQVVGGHTTDPTKPTFWFAGTNVPMSLVNVKISFPAVGLRMGIATDGNRQADTAGLYFDNLQIGLNQIAGNGPAVDVGYSYWVTFNQSVIGGNAAEAWDSDKRAAFLSKPTTGAPYTGPASGLITFNDTVLQNGGIKMYEGTTAGVGAYIMGTLTTENPLGDGVNGGAALWFPNADNTTSAFVSHIELADADTVDRAVRVGTLDTGSDFPGSFSSSVTLGDVNHTLVEGPVHFIGGRAATIPAQTAPALNQGGVMAYRNSLFTRLEGLQDSARRLGGAVAVPYTNIAIQDASTWAAEFGTSVVTTGQADIFGGTSGAQMAASLSAGRRVVNSSLALTVGDWIVFGVWGRSNTGPGYVDNNTSVALDLSASAGNLFDNGTNGVFCNRFTEGTDNQWDWWGCIGRLGTVTTTPGTVRAQVRVAVGASVIWAFPTAFKVPAAAGESEAWDALMHLAAYPGYATTGDVATLPGRNFWTDSDYKWRSGTLFAGTLRHNNSAARNYDFPDADIAVSGSVVQSCGTAAAGSPAACGETNISPTAKFVVGTVAMNGATPSVGAITSMPAFTSTVSYACIVTGQTDRTDTFKAINVSSTAFTITGPDTSVSVVSYLCAGN